MRKGAIAEGFDDLAHYKFLEMWQQGRCYYCDAPADRYHREHVIPVAKDGRHAAANLVLACAACNSSKRARLLWQEWIPPLAFNTPLLLPDTPAPVVSTFAASERGREDARGVLPALRAEHPGQPLFFDWEWWRRTSAVMNLLDARRGAAEVWQARRTQVVELDVETARDFFETHHVQGFGRGSVYLGLACGETLVAASAWLAHTGTVELNRLAFRGRVVGGFGKLLAAFRRDYLPSGVPLVSFVDQRYADGHSYEKLGFKNVGETAHPVYYYVGPTGMFHRRLFTRELQKSRFTVFFDELSERQNARINGHYRLFGLPQLRFLMD